LGKYSDNEGLSVLDLVNSGTIDTKLAALLWTLMENRASVLVAAGPSSAGKTTLFHALLDFLPPEIKQIALRGDYEDFQFVNSAHPEKAYLTAEEIGYWGYAEYLRGEQALRAFELLPQGYALGAAIHGRTSEEVIYVLHQMLGIPVDLIARLGVIVNLRVTAGANWNDQPVRRVTSVDLVLPAQEGLAVQVLAARQSTEKGFDYLTEGALHKALAGKHLIGKGNIKAELEEKTEVLSQWLNLGLPSRKAVRKAVRDYYKAKQPGPTG
jgi:energy-coupling factor transporter ATP-binding protein EcfA2